MQILLKLSRWINTCNEWIGRFVGWLVVAMVLVGVWNAIGRYVGRAIGTNLTSNAAIEIQWYLFDIVFLLGAAYALKHDEHVRVDVFYSRWSPRQQALIDFLGTVLFLIPFCLLVIFFSWNTIAQSWQIQEMSPDPNGLPRYPIKSAIIISFGLLSLQGISQAIQYFAIFTGQLEPQEERHESEL
ncbi:TRAP transporter small permease subunit [Oxynema sp. CENA135]|uniref:TRAP transporter small permease subunit n=1 Tax=Oxynema sp. CENA135 TaxID=984206 RepID=UPI00190E4B32|nr:TRAP transporter small permease subunit [Oxynema sp. CENA135]MBK4730883.1 TRAP transporter small permease subunit [Oxynema sp. CENA135]